MDWARLALDYLDTLLWPLVVVVLFAFFTSRFKTNIGGLINRIQKLSAGGVDIVVLPQSPVSPWDSVDKNALAGVSRTHSEIASVTSDRMFLKGEDVQLILNFEALTTLYQFQKIYRMIYGTQLNLMYHLQGLPGGTASSETVNAFYDDHIRLIEGRTGYTPDRIAYFNFLRDSKMIYSEEEKSYGLARWGTAFLAFIDQEGLPRNKDF